MKFVIADKGHTGVNVKKTIRFNGCQEVIPSKKIDISLVAIISCFIKLEQKLNIFLVILRNTNV
jgi:hypothetical protein